MFSPLRFHLNLFRLLHFRLPSGICVPAAAEVIWLWGNHHNFQIQIQIQIHFQRHHDNFSLLETNRHDTSSAWHLNCAPDKVANIFYDTARGKGGGIPSGIWSKSWTHCWSTQCSFCGRQSCIQRVLQILVWSQEKYILRPTINVSSGDSFFFILVGTFTWIWV